MLHGHKLLWEKILWEKGTPEVLNALGYDATAAVWYIISDIEKKFNFKWGNLTDWGKENMQHT